MSIAATDRRGSILGVHTVAVLYIALVATTILGDIFYWTVSRFFAGYAKLFFYSALLIMLIDLFKNGRLLKNSFVLVMSVLGVLYLLVGLYNNQIAKPFFAHFVPFLLATIVYSYGMRAEKFGNISRQIDRKLILAGYGLTGLVIIYYPLVQLGIVEYFGAGALFALPIFYAIRHRLYTHAGIFYVACVFTGKRSILLVITLVLLFYFAKRPRIAAMISLAGLVIFATYGSLIVTPRSPGVVFGSSLDRYFIILKYLAENDDPMVAVDLATSGRLFDALAVVERLGDNMVNWIIGLGFGATFSVDYSFSDETHTTHYSHVSPFSYLLVGGLLLLGVVYTKIVKDVILAFRNLNDHYSMMILYFFFAGFSGAIFFTDVFVWLIFGIFVARRANDRSERVAMRAMGVKAEYVGS